LKPIFKGEEVKMDNKKTVPFQRGQMQKIIEILGTPTRTPSYPYLPQLHPQSPHPSTYLPLTAFLV
jgi:cyclin-dependent kinase 8/11